VNPDPSQPHEPRDTARRAALWALALLPLAGCVSVSVGHSDLPPTVLYQLQDARPAAPAPSSGSARLAIQSLGGDPTIDGLPLVFLRRPGELAYYQFAAWSERPSRRLGLLAQQRLDASGRFAVVTQLGQPIATDWLLTLALDTLVHDVATPPGRVQLALRAELIRRSDRSRVGQRLFAAAVPTTEAAAPAAVAAFNLAVAEVFDQLGPWVESTIAAQPR
jgi:cholesterol transport system auxiliary component